MATNTPHHEAQLSPQSPTNHTNGAVATHPHQMTGSDPLPHAMPLALMAEAIRPRVAQVVDQVLNAVIEQEVMKALTGKVAPAFPLPPMQAPRITNAMKRCSEDGCTNPVRSKGKCSAHYQKERRAANAAAAKVAKKSSRRRR